MNNLGRKLGIILAALLLFVSLMAISYANVVVPVKVFESYYANDGTLVQTNTPVKNVNAIGFICNTNNCEVLGNQYLNQVNSGNSNELTFTFPTNAKFPNGGAYGIYLYNENYIGWELNSTLAGTGTLPTQRVQFAQIQKCRISIDEFAVINDAHPNEPIMVDVSTSLDSTVSNPILNSGVLEAIPNSIKRTYQLGATVNLKIKDSNGNVVNSQSRPILLDYSSSKRVEFSYVPTTTGRYTATVETVANDGKCRNTQPHTATQQFSIINKGPIEQCYVLLDNLDASEQNVYVGDNVDFTVEKIANYYDSYGNLHTIPATLYVKAFKGSTQVNAQTIQSAANSNVVNPKIESFSYTPQSQGYHKVGVTASVPNCPYPTVTTDAVDVTVYRKEGRDSERPATENAAVCAWRLCGDP